MPIIIGGSKGKAFERIAKHGDGWYAPTASVDQLAPLMKTLEEACRAEGRDPSTVEVSAMWIPPAEGVEAIPRYEDLGVSRLVVPLFALEGGPTVEAIERFGNDVLAKLR